MILQICVVPGWHRWHSELNVKCICHTSIYQPFISLSPRYWTEPFSGRLKVQRECVSPLKVTHLPPCMIFDLPWHRHPIEVNFDRLAQPIGRSGVWRDKLSTGRLFVSPELRNKRGLETQTSPCVFQHYGCVVAGWCMWCTSMTHTL